ncbi:hypothetical protein JCM10449v2_007879 [Rhodotorula kratochvilovae]
MALSPEEQILTNAAALHSLKRPQLLALCKQFGLKGAGKNTDLIARLEAHGAFLAAQSRDTSVCQEADASSASWALVDGEAVPAAMEELAEFGVQDTRSAQGSLTGSASSGSIASSTIRSAGATLLRALVDPGRRDKAAGAAAPVERLYPSLPPAPSMEKAPTAPSNDSEPSMAEDEQNEADDDGGIRLVSSRSTVHDTSMDTLPAPDSPAPPLPHAAPAFIFGSPPPQPAPTAASTFTFSMPGALFASTSSTASDAATVAAEPPASTMDAIMAEMNRRAAESRLTAPLPRSGSSLFSSAASGVKPSPSKGSKAAFDASHKRRFDKMDSITTHWAAKRALPSSSSLSDLAGMPRSGSGRSFAAKAADARPQVHEPAPKRLKPSTSKPFGLSRLGATGGDKAASEKRLVSALRDEGWSAAPAATTSVSLSSSMRPQARPRDVREDVRPREEQVREQRRRQLELAKARRKSGAANGAGMSRRRPSLGVGPKPTGSTASRFFKSTMRKLAPASSLVSSAKTAPPPRSSSTSSRTIAPSASTRALAPSTSAAVPRFAASTASSSSRSALSSNGAAASPPKKAQPGWKKFDLQASLQRPLSWKPHPAAAAPASPVAPRPSAAFRQPGSAAKRPAASAQGSLTRTTSSRVANRALLSPVRPAPLAEEPPAAAATAEEKLAALPAAPSTLFAASQPLQPVTNVAPTPPSATAAWQPPAVTKKPVLPSASSPAATPSSSAAAPAPKKKLVSSSTRAARGGDKARGKAQIEGLESRARKVRAASAKTREARK